ncbi:enoyl-CoA hydratase/isomerase family protein [Candidatus Poriferisocius sp.]|uniref:enoyl-CoA hydratase/isomerase family protein n=1 Tax=Candidatus Poriferisocius sp. TaxID=3101276 RepID=UPI003B02B2B5
MLEIEDHGRVRLLRLNRPEALNAFNEALYDATAQALIDAAAAPDVAVLVVTGTGRSFCAGTDLVEMGARNPGGDGVAAGIHGFPGMIDRMASFPKPFIVAVNGLALGVGATMLGFADLVFMSSEARLRCPFSSLGVAPEAASSYTFPLLLGRQQAMWMLLSSEWISAAEASDMGLIWKVCPPGELMGTTMAHAQKLAVLPVSSLMESKALITCGWHDGVAAARERENAAFSRLMGAPANVEAIAAFMEKRPPDFTGM